MGAVAIAFIAMQLVPVNRTNPPVTGDVSAPPEVAHIIRRACYDCHSHEAHWPWYGYVAPVSWLLESDISEARNHLNFSQWSEYSANKQARLCQDIWEEVDNGDMPLPGYLLIHRRARLSDEDKHILHRWLQSMSENHR